MCVNGLRSGGTRMEAGGPEDAVFGATLQGINSVPRALGSKEALKQGRDRVRSGFSESPLAAARRVDLELSA